MKRLFRVKGIAANLFYLAVACFFAFFLYIGAAERVSVELAEPQHGYEIVTAQEERVEDPAAPIGVRRVYRLEAREGTLCFNIAHHEIRLWLEDQKIYTLTGDAGNRIAENVGSNWCSVDFAREDAGKTVTVELTPMFPAAMGKSPDFWLGDHFAMASGVLRQELPSLVLAALSVLLAWFLATSCFVILDILGERMVLRWLPFLYAVPVSMVVWLIFNSIWFNTRRNYLIISLLMWTALISAVLTVLAAGHSAWTLLALGVPGQIIILVWSRLQNVRKK